MPKRAAPTQQQQQTRTTKARLAGVMEHTNRSRSPMDLSVPDADATSRLDDAAAVAASAAVAVADSFDVRASLTRAGSIRASRMEEMMFPSVVPSLRKDDDDGDTVAVTQAPVKNVGEISNGMKSANDKAVDNQLGNKNDGDDDDDYDDIETSPRKYSFGQSRSIEEASVNTTVESITMEDAERATSSDTIVPDSTITEGETTEGETSTTQVKIRLTPEESRLFTLLTEAAEAYEAGHLAVDPNGDVSARGGFVKQDPNEDKSWLKLPPKVEKIEIRVAGGWVRDKLLNQHSCDVDIALDCMMGVQFARIVQSYMALQQEKEEKMEEEKKQEKKEENTLTSVAKEEEIKVNCDNETKKDNIPHSKKGKAKKQNNEKKKKQPKIGVIGANPSQSKHLETATMNVHSIDVDFVNLRAEEVYLPGSRIPTSDTRMFGTPLEDALRRDFTINSLFYNVRSGRIEDWTGRGLDDLMVHRRIVTPVDPHVTFHDDPLRVLRAIRFAVRLDFDLDETIAEAARSHRVHHSLHVKVSRERVGKELEGMLTGKHAKPAKALNMIADLHLAGSVFCFPGSFPGDSSLGSFPGDSSPGYSPVVSGNILDVPYSCSLRKGNGDPEATKLASRQRSRGWEESSALLALLPALMDGHAAERGRLESSPTDLNPRLLHLCAFILPFHNLSFPDKKGRKIWVTAHMIKEALKFPIRDVQAVSKILSNVDEMAEILSEVRSQLQKQETREEGDAPVDQLAQEKGDVPAELSLCRLRVGLLLRQLKEHWVTCLLTAAAWEIRACRRRDEMECDDFQCMVDSARNSEAASPTSSATDARPSRELYRAVVSDLDLDNCWRVPPHLNGKQLIKELELPKGPVVGEYLDDQTRWMLRHPEGTKEECAAHLHARKREREEAAASKEEEDRDVEDSGAADGKRHPARSEGANGVGRSSKKVQAEG